MNFAKFPRTPFVIEHLWTIASEPNLMKLHLWISEEHLSVLSYGTPFLIRKSFQGLKTLFWWNSAGTVISWWVWSLISLEVLWRLAGLSVTLGFSSQTRKKAFPNFLLEYYQRKKWAIKRSDVLAQGTVMLCLYYYVFLMSSYILKMFLLAMFGKSIIVLLESSLCFETTMKQFEAS